MSEKKSFRSINGWMFVFVFATSAIVAAVSIRSQHDSGMIDVKAKPDFARLIRAEDKSYFGFHRYYFTVLYKTKSSEARFVIPVDSNLFHRRKVGDNVEVIANESSQHHANKIRIKGNLGQVTDYGKMIVSLFLAAVGVLFLLMSFILTRDKHITPRITKS